MICKDPVYIIAEAGVNHCGNINIAIKLIDKAKKCGVVCIKFQTFKAAQRKTSDSYSLMYVNH